MPVLPDSLFNKVVDLLVRHFPDKDARKSFLVPSLSLEGIFYKIDWDGAPLDFTRSLVHLLEPTLLVRVLRVLQDARGEETREQAEQLISELSKLPLHLPVDDALEGPLAVSNLLWGEVLGSSEEKRNLLEKYHDFEETHFPERKDFIGFSPPRWRSCFQDFEKYFEMVVRTEGDATVAAPLTTFAHKFSDGEVGNALLVGEKGVGKTTFLLNLYLYWKEHLIRSFATGDESAVMPFFVRLSALEAWENGRIDNDAIDNAVVATVEAIDDIVAALEPREIVILLDGVNQTGDHRIEMTAKLIRELREKLGDIRFVISAENMRDVQALVAEEGISVQEAPLSFQSVALDDHGRLAELIARFCALAGLQDPPRLLKQLQTKDVPHIDFFILTQFATRFSGREYSGLTLAECYRMLCGGELSDAAARRGVSSEALLKLVAPEAFKILITRETKLSDIEDEAIARLLSRHLSVTHFLVALHLVYVILQANADSSVMRQHMGYVFPAQVNSFIKQIMKADEKVENGIIGIIENRYSSLSTLGRSQCCYLAGRVTPRHRLRMLRFLGRKFQTIDDQFNQLRRRVQYAQPVKNERSNRWGKRERGSSSGRNDDSPTRNAEQMRDLRMLRRCILISRTRLGDQTADRTYADMLLRDKEENRFNSGFHLEYYGDTEFRPDGRMSSTDDGTASCHQAVTLLMRRLTRPQDPRLAQEWQLPQIELVTALSMAQLRHQRGQLDPEIRQSLVALLEEVLSQFSTQMEPIVLAYVRRMSADLRREDFNLGETMGEWYRLKRIERTGWINRREKARQEGRSGWEGVRIESVAEHSFFTVLTALHFLDRPAVPAEKFDKERVLRMLFVHDLGEARVGDNLEQNKVKELAALYDYAAFGTYEGVSNLWEIPELYDEFTSGQTASAKVARDIDKLEFIFQSRLYGGALTDSEHQGCEQEADEFETATVRQVLKLMTDFPKGALV